MSKLTDYLKEQPPLERFEIQSGDFKEIGGIGKDLITLSKKGPKMDTRKFLSKLRDLEDELANMTTEIENFLRPHG